uniref:Uncharacterized protein n=1 Tax=Biomphalaria glabrata TaxID=6526 RepID=A0A2C9LJH0_BIOGL
MEKQVNENEENVHSEVEDKPENDVHSSSKVEDKPDSHLSNSELDSDIENLEEKGNIYSTQIDDELFDINKTNTGVTTENITLPFEYKHGTNRTQELQDLNDHEFNRFSQQKQNKIPEIQPSLHNISDKLNASDHIASDRSTNSVVQRGQYRAEQLISSISQTQKKMKGFPLVKPTRSRIPPKLVRLATVYSSTTRSERVPRGPSLYYVEPQRPLKVISWDEANNARPPLKIDMEGPNFWTYSPKNKPLYENNAPSFTFGTKCYPEKAGGSNTSWAKTWFQPIDPWHNKSDFKREGKWPSPNQYHKPSLLGPRQRTLPESPAYTFGHKFEIIGTKAGSKGLPSPSDYNIEKADSLTLHSGPSFSHQFRREGTVLWCSTEKNPGPAAYSPLMRPRQEQPAYTIQGIRREKSQLLGPFSTL